MICTKESRLGGRSAQFVAQFYNKKKPKNNQKDDRLSHIEIDLISNWGS